MFCTVAFEVRYLHGEEQCFTMTEPLDADLLNDLRGLGKPPTCDVDDADYQECRFIVRVHMSSVSSISQALTRLMQSSYAPDTQNRQYALMQKIMIPVKPWCDQIRHRSFPITTCIRVHMQTVQLFEPHCCNDVIIPTICGA